MERVERGRWRGMPALVHPLVDRRGGGVIAVPAVPRFTVVLAGGGERVMAWEVGVLAGLADAGLDSSAAAGRGGHVGRGAGRGAPGRRPGSARRRRPIAAAPPSAPAAADGARELFASFATAWEAAGGTPRAAAAFGRLTLAASPGAEQEVVDRLARRLPSRAWPVGLRIVAVDAQDGERVALDAGSDVRTRARGGRVLRDPDTAAPRSPSEGGCCVDGLWDQPRTPTSVARSDAS